MWLPQKYSIYLKDGHLNKPEIRSDWMMPSWHDALYIFPFICMIDECLFPLSLAWLVQHLDGPPFMVFSQSAQLAPNMAVLVWLAQIWN